ncbi:energy transducer TonB family protein [Bradyrhizobium sp. HKCCYLS20291]|uniref:energy transducer TonB family protein n=1 Tax=Bradyrhizobium sp. HKCCYLS20291 TaxID=3420766 RepID=UPI003EBA441D
MKDAWLKGLAVQLKAEQRYPPQAGRQGGAAKVLLHIDRSGRLISAALLESTGDPALDKEALAMVERAQPFAPPPGEVSDDNLTMRVQIVFAPKPVPGTMQDVGPEGRELRAKLNSICRGC